MPDNNALIATRNWPGQVVGALGQPWTGRNFAVAGAAVSGMVPYFDSAGLLATALPTGALRFAGLGYLSESPHSPGKLYVSQIRAPSNEAKRA